MKIRLHWADLDNEGCSRLAGMLPCQHQHHTAGPGLAGLAGEDCGPGSGAGSGAGCLLPRQHRVRNREHLHLASRNVNVNNQVNKPL